MSGQTRRTKAQKMKTAEKRLTYSYVANAAPQTAQQPKILVTASRQKNAVNELFPYDVQLIYSDLRKTMVVTTLILTFLIGFYLKFR